jgi:hypothetical protein
MTDLSLRRSARNRPFTRPGTSPSLLQRTETIMCRVRIIAAAGALALAGCSGATSSNSSWFKLKSPAPSLQTLQFESEPPGAEVKTAQGEGCRTPCALAVPLAPQSVTFAMNGYLPQTVPVQVQQSGERSEMTYDSDPPKFAPNPVEAALQPAAPPPKPPPPPKKLRKAAAKPKTASSGAPPGQAYSAQPFRAPPAPAHPSAASPFPPPPAFPPPQAR